MTVLCLISVTVSPISESWRCSARLRIPPRERRRLSSAYAQSLGELAKKEKERRKKVTDESKVVTNDDLSRFKNAPVATGVLPPRPAEQKPAKEMTGVEAKSSAAGAAKENPDEPVDLRGDQRASGGRPLEKRARDLRSWRMSMPSWSCELTSCGAVSSVPTTGSGDRQSSGSFKRRSFNGTSTRKSWRRQRHDSKSWKKKLAEAALFRDGSLRKPRNSLMAASRC